MTPTLHRVAAATAIGLALWGGELAAAAHATSAPASAPTPLATATPAPATAHPQVTPLPGGIDMVPADKIAASPAEIPRVTPQDAAAAVKAGTAVIVDVRDDGSWNAGHVKGALHIPFADLERRVDELPRDKRIIAYCS